MIPGFINVLNCLIPSYPAIHPTMPTPLTDSSYSLTDWKRVENRTLNYYFITDQHRVAYHPRNLPRQLVLNCPTTCHFLPPAPRVAQLLSLQLSLPDLY